MNDKDALEYLSDNKFFKEDNEQAQQEYEDMQTESARIEKVINAMVELISLEGEKDMREYIKNNHQKPDIEYSVYIEIQGAVLPAGPFPTREKAEHMMKLAKNFIPNECYIYEFDNNEDYMDDDGIRGMMEMPSWNNNK